MRKQAMRTIAGSIAFALLMVLLAGCGPRRLLYDVAIRPQVISPNADGEEDISELQYSLARQSSVSIYLVDQDGQKHYFRRDKRRSKADRTAYFSGVIDGRLLPDGEYSCVFEAVDERGYRETVKHPLAIVQGDKVPLQIDNLGIWPHKFTPNRDGITDRVRIGYSLNKEAGWVEVYLLDEQGNKYPVEEDLIREMGSQGSHEHDFHGGVDLGAVPPPDGDYIVVVEARDAVGNAARVEGQLTIEGGGIPLVEIVNRAAQFSASVVKLGSTLTFTCTVKNIGKVPVRTTGPEPGTTYTTEENYNTLGEYEEPGLFRVGLDFEGNSVGRIYPFRWQLGTDEELTIIETEIGAETYLMPGQTVTVIGHLRIDEPPPKTESYYWIGLIHEQVRVVQDRVEPTPITLLY